MAENKNKKIRCGSGRKRTSNWLKVSMCLDNMKQYAFEGTDGKMYVKVDINIYDEVNEFKKDVSVTVDTWKPKEDKPKEEATEEVKQERTPEPPPPEPSPEPTSTGNDVEFGETDNEDNNTEDDNNENVEDDTPF